MACGYSFTATLNWANTFADLDLYASIDGVTVYYGNPSSGGLTWSGPGPPESITGSFSVAHDFKVWYSQRTASAPTETPTTASVNITNTGTDTMYVNGCPIGPGGSYVVNGLAYGGYNTGPIPGFGGGTTLMASCTSVPAQGPYAHGTSGTCPCWGCNCCPPANTFQCGVYVQFSVGTQAPFAMDQKSEFPSVPQYQFKPIASLPQFMIAEPVRSEDGEWVYAMADGCSIPVNPDIKVYLFSGDVYGIEIVGNDLYAVGSGSITMLVDPPNGPGDCGVLVPKINGSTGPAPVNDGDLLNVTLESVDDPICCICKKVGVGNDGGGGGPFGPVAYRYKGRSYIPKQTLIENILARRIKVMNRLRRKI